MLLLLMSPQFLDTAIPLATIIVTTKPEAVVLDSEVNRLPVSVEITRTSERFGAERARSALNRRHERWQIVWGRTCDHARKELRLHRRWSWHGILALESRVVLSVRVPQTLLRKETSSSGMVWNRTIHAVGSIAIKFQG